MTILEQRFLEQVPGTLHRIAEALEGICGQLKEQNQLLRKNAQTEL